MEEAPPRHRCRWDATASCVLPEDALYEILLRLPAKDLCRFRAVCRPWRSFLSDPHFVGAHASRHPEPLVVVGYEPNGATDQVLYDIVDLSGRVIKRVHAAAGDDDDGGLENKAVVRTQDGLACITNVMGTSCQLLNLATGAVHALPDGLAAEHTAAAAQGQEQQDLLFRCELIVFGLVPSTGEYKVLRMVYFDPDVSYPATRILYEVLTVDGSCQARWRGKQGPPYDLYLEFNYGYSSVVISGIVYFLLSGDYWDFLPDEGLVGAFDLETEKWRPSIRGPSSGHNLTYLEDIKLVALSGCLALCCQTSSSTMDIWFLTDFNKDSWVKQQSININFSLLHVPNLAQPLLVLNDGRIAGHKQNWAFILQDYNQNTIHMNEPHTKCGMTVGSYGGNLLSLENCMI